VLTKPRLASITGIPCGEESCEVDQERRNKDGMGWGCAQLPAVLKCLIRRHQQVNMGVSYSPYLVDLSVKSTSLAAFCAIFLSALN